MLLAGCSATLTPRIPTTRESDFAQRNKQKEDIEYASAEVRAAFEAPEQTVYLLGPGDEITVDVFGRPELSAKHILGPNGGITLPVVGDLEVGGQSVAEATKTIARALRRFYVEPAVSIRVDRYVANQVLILGRVAQPGALHFESTPTLLEAITRAGALPIGGVGADKAALNRLAIFRGRDRVLWIDLKALLRGYDLSSNLRLARNDIIYLPDADDQLIYVMGEVNKPGAYRLTPDMSFLDALATAGGPTVDAAPDRIRLARPDEHLERDIDLASIAAGNPESNYSIKEGDVIYVPKNGVAAVGYVLQKLSPVSSILLFGAALGL